MGTTLVQELEWMFQHITQNFGHGAETQKPGKSKNDVPIS